MLAYLIASMKKKNWSKKEAETNHQMSNVSRMEVFGYDKGELSGGGNGML